MNWSVRLELNLESTEVSFFFFVWSVCNITFLIALFTLDVITKADYYENEKKKRSTIFKNGVKVPDSSCYHARWVVSYCRNNWTLLKSKTGGPLTIHIINWYGLNTFKDFPPAGYACTQQCQGQGCIAK